MALEFKQNYRPEVGDVVVPDGWKPFGAILKESDGFSDGSFPGCQFRMETPRSEYNLAVNITLTGRDTRKFQGEYGWVRVKIEFVGDGEPSDFSSGWMKKKSQ